MTYTRKNVWELGNDWADEILWYARGVQAMQKRELDDPKGWRFYAAIHGFDQSLWQSHGYWSPGDRKPNDDDKKRFWSQCQHGSWYFLPWHRGYLMAFEETVRAEIVGLGYKGEWALPYWNYFKPNQFKLPPGFADKDWPDGKGNNPLYVQQRFGPDYNGNVYVDLRDADLGQMDDHDFIGVYSARGSRGFGGPKTRPLFAHAGSDHGGIETQPHDQVHVMVGGRDPIRVARKGLMTDPRLAGLDPIFWLHHANMDRLWEVWRLNPPTNLNPTDPAWLAGPAIDGEQKFSMPKPDGSSWDYTPEEMQNLGALGYVYDDVSPPGPPRPPTARLLRLGVSPERVEAIVQKEGGVVASETNVELIGKNAGPLQIEGLGASTSVRLDANMSRKVASSFALNVNTPAPDRVFLNLENVRGVDDSAILQVYVDLPEGASPADHPELRAGSLALFGLEQASLPDGPHAGQGLNLGLEITKVIDTLQVDDKLNTNALDVRIVPRNPVPEDAKISIGRVSIFRQGK